MGSSDSSIEIIKDYASKDNRINTAFIKGHGPSIPRNYGMRRAVGKYILFIDSDDYLPTGALQTLVEKTYEFPSADFIRGNQRVLVNDVREDQSVFLEARRKYADKILGGEEFLVDVLYKDYTPINSLFKREFLSNNNIEFDEELCIHEDCPFIIEIGTYNPLCVYINEETYVYRLGNITSVTNSKKSHKKCVSLVGSATYSKKFMSSFGEKGRQHILKRSVEHSISAIFQAYTCLTNDEAKDIYNRVKLLWPKFPKVGESRKHRIFIEIYNISPYLACNALRLIKLFK